MSSSSSGVATIRELTQPYINVTFALSGKQLPANHGYLLYSAIARATESAGVSAGSAGILPAPARGSSPIIRDGVDVRVSSLSDRKDVSTGASVPLVSALHKTDWLAIELISGFPSSPGLISLHSSDNSKLGTGNSKLCLRLPADHYRDVLPLAGKRLDIGGHQIRLGLPVARPLEPAPSLYARVVTIKKFTEPEPFLDAVKRKLDSFGVNGRVELPHDLAPPVSLRPSDNSKLETASQYHLRQRVGSDANSKLETQNSKLRFRRRIVTIHGKSVVGFSVAVHELNDEDSLLLQAGAVKVVSPDDGSVKWQSIFSRRSMGCGIFNPIKRQVQSEEVE
jgi:CRISPR-associated protein Cas6